MQRAALLRIAAGATVAAGSIVAATSVTTPSPPDIQVEPVQLSATSDNIVDWPNTFGANAVGFLADAGVGADATYTLLPAAPPTDIDQVFPGFWMTSSQSYAVFDASDPLLAVPATGPLAGTEEVAKTYVTWFGIVNNAYYEVTDATGTLTSNMGAVADTLYLPFFGEIPISTAAFELPADFPGGAADLPLLDAVAFGLPF